MSIRLLLVVFVFVQIIQGCQLTGSNNMERHFSDPPNILILLADDLGYGDLSCYGGVARTPNLNRLAANGMQMTQFYSTAPNCSPARAGMLSGRFPTSIGVYNYMPAGHPMHLKDEVVTFAEIAQNAGYRTGHFGKWHLSNLTPDADLGQAQPHDQGFDYSLGTTNNSRPTHLNPENFVRNGKKTGVIEGYSCHIVADEALQWLGESDGDQPFLLYMAFHEPHLKLASPPELMSNYEEYPLGDAEYYANVENMDMAIGRLIDSLGELGYLDNTLIVFSSDNGSYHRGSNGNLLGGKSFVYEGGIRVPGILNWKDVIEPGQVNDEVAGLVDIMPTIYQITGSKQDIPSEFDGTSLLPLFSGSPLKRDRPLSWFFYRTYPQMAMRVNNMVILGGSSDTVRHTHPMTAPDMRYIKNLTLNSLVAYDLASDPEQNSPIDLSDLERGTYYESQIMDRLRNIQREAPVWDNLPPAKGRKRLKTEWRKLRWESFSN